MYVLKVFRLLSAGNLKDFLCAQNCNGCICVRKIWPIHCTLVRLGKVFKHILNVGS